MIEFAGWSLIGSSASAVGNHGANLALNHFFGAAINTVAGIANQIQGVLAVLLSGLIKSLAPVIFKSEGAEKVNSMVRISLLGCKYSTLLFLLLAIPVYVYTPEVLTIWLGDIPEWTILFVRLQLIRAFVEQLGLSLQYSLNATRKIRQLNLFSSIFNLLPIVILISLYNLGYPPYWHYIVMIFIISMGQNLTLILLCRKYCKLSVKDYLRYVFLPCLAVLMSILPLYVIKELLGTGGVSVILSGCIFLLAFFILVYIGLSTTEELYFRQKMLFYKPFHKD